MKIHSYGFPVLYAESVHDSKDILKRDQKT